MNNAAQADANGFNQFRHSLLLLARTQLGPQLRRKIDESDLVQQTLLEAHQHAGQCLARTSAERFAWLRRILNNNVLDAVRCYTTGKRAISREVDWEQQIRDSAMRVESWLADRQSSPSRLAERSEQLSELADALAQLSPSQREAIEAHHLRGAALAEVALQMDRSEAAVAGLLHRGLRQLRQVMSGNNFNQQLADCLNQQQS